MYRLFVIAVVAGFPSAMIILFKYQQKRAIHFCTALFFFGGNIKNEDFIKSNLMLPYRPLSCAS